MGVRGYVRKQVKRAKKYVKKRYGGSSGIQNLIADVTRLKTLVNSEKKYWDKEDFVPYSLTDSSFVTLVPFDGLTQGDGEQQRVGDQIKALYTSIKLRMELTSTSTTPANTHAVRVMVIMDNDTRYEAPIAGGTLASNVLASIATGPLQLISPYRTQQTTGIGSMGERWKVIRDFKITLDNVRSKQKDLTININHKKFSRKLMGQIVKYDSADNKHVSPRMYVLFLTDNGVADNILMTAYTRVCFVDT